MEFLTGLLIGALFFIPAQYEAKITHLKEIDAIKSSGYNQQQLKDVAIKVNNNNQKIDINYQTSADGKPNVYIQEKDNKESDVINFQCK